MIVWEGIAIEITHTANWLNTQYNHIELHCNTALPVTETGYRSHFIPTKTLLLFDSVEDFVIQWLNEHAKDPDWPKRRAAADQLSLFD